MSTLGKAAPQMDTRAKVAFHRILNELPPASYMQEDQGDDGTDYAMIEHDPTRAQANMKLPMYSEGPEFLEWRPMLKLSFINLGIEGITEFTDGGSSITCIERLAVGEDTDVRAKVQTYEQWANSPDVITGWVAIGFDNGYVLIYKERMSSVTAESLRDANSYTFHCIFGATGDARHGDPVKAISLAPDGKHVAVAYHGNDFKNRELVPYVYEFTIPTEPNRADLEPQTNIIQVHHKDDDFGEVPDYVTANTREVYRGQITAITYSHDSSLLAFGYDDRFTQGSVNIWSREAARQQMLDLENSPIEPVTRIGSVLCDALIFLLHTAEDDAADYEYTLAAGGIDGVLRAYTIDVDTVYPNVEWSTGFQAQRNLPKHLATHTVGIGALLHSHARTSKKEDVRQQRWVEQKLAERDRLLWQVRVHSRKVTALSLSKDGDRIVVTCGVAPRGESPVKIVSVSDVRNTRPNVPYQPVEIADHRPDWVDDRGEHDATFIKSAKIDPDEGCCVVTVCADNRIRLFDTHTGALTAESKQAKRLTDACFVADGYAIAAGGPDGYMYIYNNGLPESFRSVECEGPISYAAVSGCGNVVATTDRDDLKFFDAHSGTFLDVRQLGRIVNGVAFSPNVKHPYVAAACAGKNCLGQSFEDGRVSIYQFIFDRTENCYDDSAFRLEPHINPIDVVGDCENVVFDPSGLKIAVTTAKGPSGAIYMLSSIRGVTLWGSDRDGVNVGKVCFSPNAELLISSWLDGEVRLVAAIDGTFLTKFRCFERILEEPLGSFLDMSCIAWSTYTAVDPSVDNICKSYNQERYHLAVSCGVRESGLAKVTNLVRIFVFDNKALKTYSDIVNPEKDSQGASYPAVVEFEKRTIGWGSNREKNVSRARIFQVLHGFADQVTGLDFSADGSLLASSCLDGIMRLHSVINGQLIYESEHHNNRVLSVQFAPNGRILTSSSSGFWHVFPTQQYFTSVTMLIATLALQPGASRLLRAVFKRCGRLATYYSTEYHGNVNDLLMYHPDEDAFLRYESMYPFKSRIPDHPPPRLALNSSVMPTMLRPTSTVPAFRRLMSLWPHITPSQLFLVRRYGTKESKSQAYGSKNPRVSILDTIMCRPKSDETISALLHIVQHLNYCQFETIDRNSQQTAFWAVARAIPDMFHSYPDLAVLSLNLELHNVEGCKHIQFRQDNEENMTSTLVSVTDSPRWTVENEKQWSPFLVPEHLETAPDKLDVDFTKFGVTPKVVPLPGADLLWDAVVAAARRSPAVGELAFDSQIVATIVESKWREINQIFKIHLFLYVSYLGLMTYLCMYYAREVTEDTAVGLKNLYVGDGADAGVHSFILWIVTALNFWFLLHEFVKLKQLGHPEYRPVFFLVDWLAHVLFFVGIVLYAEVPRKDIQTVTFATAMLCTWIKMLFFCRVSEEWSRVTVMMHVFISKIYAFLVVMALVMVSFAFMFMTIHPVSYSSFSNFPEAFVSVLALAFGDFAAVERRADGAMESNSVIYSDWLYGAQCVLVVLYMFIVAIFFLNVLIAILSQEYTKVSKSPRWLIDHAMLIREIMCLYRFMNDEELYDISWLEIDQKGSKGNKVKFLHIIPPDNSSFWYTNLNPEGGEDALYRAIETVQVTQKEQTLYLRGRQRKTGKNGPSDGVTSAAVDTRHSVALLTDKVNTIISKVDNIIETQA